MIARIAKKKGLVLRREDPDDYVRRAVASIVVHVEAMVDDHTPSIAWLRP